MCPQMFVCKNRAICIKSTDWTNISFWVVLYYSHARYHDWRGSGSGHVKRSAVPKQTARYKVED